jgi:glycosyltransferase involved in cell wall biosynthesis
MFRATSRDRLLTEAVLTPPVRLVSPDPWVTHIPFAYWLVASVRPRTIVELGTHTGNSYSALVHATQVIGLQAACVAVDTWRGDPHAGEYGEEVFEEWFEFHQRHFASVSRLLRSTFDDALGQFEDGTIDLLHIDGCHAYEAVRHDFEGWRPKLSDRAVVLFHDTNERGADFGVYRFWDEIRHQYPHFEFQHGHGLGVLAVGAQQSNDLQWLTRLDADDEIAFVSRFFATLGNGCRYRLNSDLLERERAALSTEVRRASEALESVQKTARTSERAAQTAQETILALTSAATERDRHIEELRHTVSERDRQLDELRHNISERDATLAAILGSTSWRLAWPVRLVGGQKARLQRQIADAARAIRRTGGLQETSRRAVRLFRRDGLSGVRRGFRIVASGGQLAPTGNSGEHDRNDYAEWIRRYDTLTDDARQKMRERIERWHRHPKVSVVMPTYNTNPEWLTQAIESVRAQIYGEWQLCIADDASTDAETKAVLEHYRAIDPRIAVAFRTDNGHISAASNTALSLATGDWIVLLDHDDVLAEHALFWLVDAINNHPDAQLIYSDEDKLGLNGERRDPYFKPDWNLDLFYSHNVFCHLGAYRSGLITQVGGFRLGTEGAQDYDLVLRCIERVPAEQIHHIPRVLYHWRVHPASTAHSGDAKPYAMDAGSRALADHFQRRQVAATVTPVPGGYRVRYPLLPVPPLVSLIMPTRNGLAVLRQCVESILNDTSYPSFEILIVDNGSDDPATVEYLERVESDNRVRVIHDGRPFNYSALNNAAVAQARGEIIGLVNNDLEVITRDWLSEMVSLVLQPGVGAVGAKLLYPDDTVQHGGVIVGIGGVAGHAHKRIHKDSYGYFARAVILQSLSAVTAACLVIRKEVYQEVGGLNEADLTVAFNDVDFCLRVRDAGYRNVWTPYAQLYHHESATRGYEDTPEKQVRFEREVGYMRQRWGDALLHDPAYNPNLTLMHEDFSLAWPPRVDAWGDRGRKGRPLRTRRGSYPS